MARRTSQSFVFFFFGARAQNVEAAVRLQNSFDHLRVLFDFRLETVNGDDQNRVRIGR